MRLCLAPSRCSPSINSTGEPEAFVAEMLGTVPSPISSTAACRRRTPARRPRSSGPGVLRTAGSRQTSTAARLSNVDLLQLLAEVPTISLMILSSRSSCSRPAPTTRPFVTYAATSETIRSIIWPSISMETGSVVSFASWTRRARIATRFAASFSSKPWWAEIQQRRTRRPTSAASIRFRTDAYLTGLWAVHPSSPSEEVRLLDQLQRIWSRSGPPALAPEASPRATERWPPVPTS